MINCRAGVHVAALLWLPSVLSLVVCLLKPTEKVLGTSLTGADRASCVHI